MDYNHHNGLLPLGSFVVLGVFKKKKGICNVNLTSILSSRFFLGNCCITLQTSSAVLMAFLPINRQGESLTPTAALVLQKERVPLSAGLLVGEGADSALQPGHTTAPAHITGKGDQNKAPVAGDQNSILSSGCSSLTFGLKLKTLLCATPLGI